MTLHVITHWRLTLGVHFLSSQWIEQSIPSNVAGGAGFLSASNILSSLGNLAISFSSMWSILNHLGLLFCVMKMTYINTIIGTSLMLKRAKLKLQEANLEMNRWQIDIIEILVLLYWPSGLTWILLSSFYCFFWRGELNTLSKNWLKMLNFWAFTGCRLTSYTSLTHQQSWGLDG